MSKRETRVRFAPSPTGPLHIGGMRTALFNYLLAKKTGGKFILRIEDTDQTRYVKGAEEYIKESLNWAGLMPDESPFNDGPHGPYRQSDRKTIYAKEIQKLIKNGHAYYAFDTPDEIADMRTRLEASGQHSPKYDAQVRMSMRNSLTMCQEDVDKLLDSNTPCTIRLKVEPNQKIEFNDLIRGDVSFNSNELDDKVLMKSDGLPTYHFANIVDDHHMQISHVIRGEEWLSSTAHHVLLYRAFNWQDEMPLFAHLPLILKPTGKGKLSKRDGQKLGIPVFPLDWQSDEGLYQGFKEMGFLPEALINFLALLGWNEGTEQEVYSMEELIHAFSLEHVSKAGARFDYDKAKWFNQKYIQSCDSDMLLTELKSQLNRLNISKDDSFLDQYIELFRPRLETLKEIYSTGYYCFSYPTEFNEKIGRKKYNENGRKAYASIIENLLKHSDWTANSIKELISELLTVLELGFGGILPLLRIAICGDTKGPDIFAVMELLEKEETMNRLNLGVELLEKMRSN